MNLTIIIPTHNRHNYLRRILDYYSNTKYNILVCDSSDKVFSPVRGIKYYHYKGMPYAKKLAKITGKIKTPYALMCADDDFVVPAAIEKCINFLQNNEDYASVQGQFISFYTRAGKITTGPSYMHNIGKNSNSSNAIIRAKQQLNPYMNLVYAVHRTQNFKDVYTNTKVRDYNLLELLQTITGAMNGKHRVIPVFYCARASIAGSGGDTSVNLDEFRMMKKNKKEYDAFIDILTKHLNPKSENKSRQVLSLIEDYVEMKTNERAAIRLKIMKVLEDVSPNLAELARNTYFELKRRRNIYMTRNYKGFPYYDKSAEIELNRILQIVKKHNINSPWRPIII